jgi:hypothetical protein
MSDPLQPPENTGPTRAIAHLPGLDVEIVHRVSPDGNAEQISINLQAVPSFEAVGRWLEAANPFAMWMQATQMFWAPWLAMTNAAMLPQSASRQLSRPGADGPPPHAEDERS